MENEEKLVEEEERKEQQQAILNSEDNLRKFSVDKSDSIMKLLHDIEENYGKVLQKLTKSWEFKLQRKSVGTVKQHLLIMSCTATL